LPEKDKDMENMNEDKRICMLEGCENEANDINHDCPNCNRNRCPEHAENHNCDCGEFGNELICPTVSDKTLDRMANEATPEQI
jgi:hypothetical protein